MGKLSTKVAISYLFLSLKLFFHKYPEENLQRKMLSKNINQHKSTNYF